MQKVRRWGNRVYIKTVPEAKGDLKRYNELVKEGKAAHEATYFDKQGKKIAQQYVIFEDKRD